MNRGLALSICFTKYLIVRDCLTASMTRLGNGFTPPTVLSEAQQHLTELQTLLKQMEQIVQDKDLCSSSNRLQ